MPKRISELTRSQQGAIRSNLARKATQLGHRLVSNGLGELEKEMTTGQIKSALGVLGYVLPTLTATEVTEVVEVQNGDDLREQVRQLTAGLSKADIKTMLSTLEPEEVKALLANTDTEH